MRKRVNQWRRKEENESVRSRRQKLGGEREEEIGIKMFLEYSRHQEQMRGDMGIFGRL